ncbi:ABC transporter permease [Ralstonia solanacearum]|uniref:ABC transporter permease n=1 Tax=Ralstonia solanacearum TaxID=305 RepID=UPI0007D75D35|nr:ABC transporter permease [Ralstonia solanacearum]OAI58185.1 ABC transporter permease [Ralstonia solanacearum]
MRYVAWGLPTLYLLALVAVPTAIMLVAAFRLPGESGGLVPFFSSEGGHIALTDAARSGQWRDLLTLENVAVLFSNPIYALLFLKSAAYAVLTTLICLAAAYPLAWLIANSGQRWRNVLLLLVILPFWSNFLVRVYAWMIILSPRGYVMRGLNGLLAWFGTQPVEVLFTPAAVIIVLVYVHLPFMVLPLYANLEKHDPLLLDAARDLGANAWQRFWRVTWPLSLPGVWAGAALVFIPCFGIFAVPELVGGTRAILVGNLIKQQFLDNRDWPLGSALSLALVGAVLIVMGLASLAARPRREASAGYRRASAKGQRVPGVSTAGPIAQRKSS